jgi:hypothetical protein
VTDSVAIESGHLRAPLDAIPELRDAWHEAQEYRGAFPTPEAARAALAPWLQISWALHSWLSKN